MPKAKRKYVLLPTAQPGLFRIKSLVKLTADVRVGTLGGFVSGPDNLSHGGLCWIYPDARVINNARVFGDACIRDFARVSDNAHVMNNACIRDKAHVKGHALVAGTVYVEAYAQISGRAVIVDRASVCGHAKVGGCAKISDRASVCDKARVDGDAVVAGTARICRDEHIRVHHQVLHVTGVRFPITITPHYVCGGCRTFTHAQFAALTPERCLSPWTSMELAHYKALLTYYKTMRKINKELRRAT